MTLCQTTIRRSWPGCCRASVSLLPDCIRPRGERGVQGRHRRRPEGAKPWTPRPPPGIPTRRVRHHIVLAKVARRVSDEAVLWLLRLMLKASGRLGVPQGGVISPLLSNVYLNEVDTMLERAQAVTREEQWTRVAYARFRSSSG